MSKKYHILSLGCPKNLVDSEVFKSIFDEAKFHSTNIPEEADYILVNTCGFILPAKEESINEILDFTELKKDNPELRIIATGCLVKRYKNELVNEIPEVDYFIDLKDFNTLRELLNLDSNKVEDRSILTPSHYAYLRISDGCNNFCSYCAIPNIRGNLVSRPIEDILIEAKALVRTGVKEIIIIAQDTAQYGTDLYGKQKLPELLRKLNEIKNLAWIRVMYLHPAHLSDEIIDTMAKCDKVLKYFEIPIQHINSFILEKMNRKISKKKQVERLQRIRDIVPEAVIRTSIIVGFPDETDEIFDELKEFVSDFKFERLGVFTYSQEEGTMAAGFDSLIDEETALNRSDELMMIQQAISQDFLASCIDKELELIIDDVSDVDGYTFKARSYFDAPDIDGYVYLDSDSVKIGDLVKATIVDSWEYDLVGEVIEK